MGREATFFYGIENYIHLSRGFFISCVLVMPGFSEAVGSVRCDCRSRINCIDYSLSLVADSTQPGSRLRREKGGWG